MAAVGGALFLALQRYGQWMTGKLADAPAAAVRARPPPRSPPCFDAIYRSPVRVGLSAALHLAGWIASAVGTWIAFRLIGVHVDLCLGDCHREPDLRGAQRRRVRAERARRAGSRVRGARAVVRRRGGIRAGRIALLKRARDIAVGVPILLIWQAVEGRRALAAAAAGNLVTIGPAARARETSAPRPRTPASGGRQW